GDSHSARGALQVGLADPVRARADRLSTPRSHDVRRDHSVKVLITGGAGFIGSHLSQLLLDGGDEVFVLDDLSTGSLENVVHLTSDKRFHLVVDSVLQPAIVNELVNKVDAVFHLAAAVGVKTIVEQPVRTLRVNLGG